MGPHGDPSNARARGMDVPSHYALAFWAAELKLRGVADPRIASDRFEPILPPIQKPHIRFRARL